MCKFLHLKQEMCWFTELVYDRLNYRIDRFWGELLQDEHRV